MTQRTGISIPANQIRGMQTWLNRYGEGVDRRVRIGMQAAKLEMESEAKITVDRADLVDTGRLRSSLVPSIIDGGYAVKMYIDLDGDAAPNVGVKSGTPRGAIAVANYAAKFEPRVGFMRNGLEAAKRKFLQIMNA